MVRKLKKILIATFFLSLIFTATVFADYVGSKNSDKYHHITCRWAQRINAENKITFKTAKEAQSKGYKPCKVCKPPVEDKKEKS